MGLSLSLSPTYLLRNFETLVRVISFVKLSLRLKDLVSFLWRGILIFPLPQSLIKKNFQHTGELKEEYNDYPSTFYLDFTTVNLFPSLFLSLHKCFLLKVKVTGSTLQKKI